MPPKHLYDSFDGSPSCMPPWIELARNGTVRDLSEAIEWAHTQRDLDYRAWSTADFPSPPDQVRTSVHPVSDIAAHPTPETLDRVALPFEVTEVTIPSSGSRSGVQGDPGRTNPIAA